MPMLLAAMGNLSGNLSAVSVVREVCCDTCCHTGPVRRRISETGWQTASSGVAALQCVSASASASCRWIIGTLKKARWRWTTGVFACSAWRGLGLLELGRIIKGQEGESLLSLGRFLGDMSSDSLTPAVAHRWASQRWVWLATGGLQAKQGLHCHGRLPATCHIAICCFRLGPYLVSNEDSVVEQTLPPARWVPLLQRLKKIPHGHAFLPPLVKYLPALCGYDRPAGLTLRTQSCQMLPGD